MKEKSLAKNSIFFVMYRLLNVIFPLITVTYVSKVILASGVGKVASAQNIVQYFVLIAALGIPNYGIREIAKVKLDNKKTNMLFSELFTINFISTLICTICYYVMIATLDIYSDERILYYIVGINIILNVFNVDWFYQGFENYAYITVRSFIIKIVSLVALLILVRTINDYALYALIHVIGVAGNNLVNFFNLRKYNIHFSIKNINLTKHFKSIFILLCTTIAIELYTMVDTTMLTFMCSDEIVGYYTNSVKVVKIVITLVTALGGVLLPRLSFYYVQNQIQQCEVIVNKIFSIIFFLFIPCGIGIFLTAESIVNVLFGPSFAGAVVTLQIASFLIYALGFSNLFGTQVLLTFNEEKKLLFATILGAISNICMNAILIPKFQQNGAAIASVISELIVTIVTYGMARQHLKIRLEKEYVIKVLVSCIIMMSSIICLRYFMGHGLIFLVCAVALGAFAYLICNFALKNNLLWELKKLIRHHGY